MREMPQRQPLGRISFAKREEAQKKLFTREREKRQGKDRDTQMGMGGGVKFPSGFQLGRINSVLELTLTPRLPPLLTGQVTCTHSRGLQRDSDCITASLTASEVAENGKIREREP